MKFSDLTGALRFIAGGVVFVTLYANFGPEPEPTYRDVIVTKEVIKEVERVDTVVTFVEKVFFVTPKAETAATAPGGAVSDVERFCGPDVQPSGDSIAPVEDSVPFPPVLLLRSARLEDGWFFQKDRLVLTGPLSNGDLRQMTYRTRGSFQVATHQDSVIVQYPRGALLKEGIEASAFVLLGYFLGMVF